MEPNVVVVTDYPTWILMNLHGSTIISLLWFFALVFLVFFTIGKLNEGKFYFSIHKPKTFKEKLGRFFRKNVLWIGLLISLVLFLASRKYVIELVNFILRYC